MYRVYQGRPSTVIPVHELPTICRYGQSNKYWERQDGLIRTNCGLLLNPKRWGHISLGLLGFLPAHRRVARDLPHSQNRIVISEIGMSVPLERCFPCPKWNSRKAKWENYSTDLGTCIRLKAIIATKKRNSLREYRKGDERNNASSSMRNSR